MITTSPVHPHFSDKHTLCTTARSSNLGPGSWTHPTKLFPTSRSPHLYPHPHPHPTPTLATKCYRKPLWPFPRERPSPDSAAPGSGALVTSTHTRTPCNSRCLVQRCGGREGSTLAVRLHSNSQWRPIPPMMRRRTGSSPSLSYRPWQPVLRRQVRAYIAGRTA